MTKKPRMLGLCHASGLPVWADEPHIVDTDGHVYRPEHYQAPADAVPATTTRAPSFAQRFLDKLRPSSS